MGNATFYALNFIAAAPVAGTTYFGSTSLPADGVSATNATATITLTPVASMAAGDLCIAVCQSLASATWTNGVTGGQTWIAEAAHNGTAGPYCRTFWCRFNGTWAASPRFDSTSATCTSAIMHVFRPDVGTKLWGVDNIASAVFAAPSTPFTVNRAGLTTAHADSTALACWHSIDDNTLGTISGTGWTGTGTAQYRNTAGNGQSAAFTHYIATTNGTVIPTVSQNQTALGGDAGVTRIGSWYCASEYSDSFDNYANSSVLNTTAGWASAGANLLVVNPTGTAGSIQANGSSACARYSAPFNENQYSEITLATLTGTTAIGVAVSVLDANNWYIAQHYPNAPTTIYVARFVAGAYADLVTTATLSSAPVAGDVLRLERSGSGSAARLTVKINGNAISGLTNLNPGAYITGGFAGIFGNGAPGTPTATSWRGGNL
jgi:hypothetical protein